MTKIELVARLIALEQGAPESNWRDFESEARAAYRQIGITKKESEEEIPEAEEIIVKTKIMLQSINGRRKLIAHADRGRRSRILLN